jgi:hypothetical protein
MGFSSRCMEQFARTTDYRPGAMDHDSSFELEVISTVLSSVSTRRFAMSQTNDERSRAEDQDIGGCLDRLASAQPDQLELAAAELARLGVWRRGSTRPRGSLKLAADNRLPEQKQLRGLLRLLVESSAALQCQIALALGEWGDRGAAMALRDLLKSSFEGNAQVSERVQLYIITALRTIGGTDAVDGLRLALEHGGEAVRDAAILAISELATKGRSEDLESPIISSAGRESTGTTVSVLAIDHNIYEDVRGALENIYRNPEISTYLRRQAADVLTYFKDQVVR